MFSRALINQVRAFRIRSSNSFCDSSSFSLSIILIHSLPRGKQGYISLAAGCHHQTLPLPLYITNKYAPQTRHSYLSLVPICEGSLRQRCFLREHCPEEMHQSRGLMTVTNSSASSCFIHLSLMELRRLQSICYLQSMSSIKEHEEQFLGVRLISLV